MDIIGGWDSIDFNWSNNAMFVMYGCRTSYASDDSGQGFASKLSLLDNFKDVNVWGQTESTYPSYFPDIRTTSIMRSINIGWSFHQHTWLPVLKVKDGMPYFRMIKIH